MIRTDVVKVADVGMVQCTNALRFPLESLYKPLRGKLDGHVSIETRVMSAVALSHTALADERKDFIGTDLFA